MKLRMVLDHAGGHRFDEDDYGGTFEMAVDAPFDRMPTIDESVRLGDALILTVQAVIWCLDGEAEVRLAVDFEASGAMLTRRDLVAAGWVELEPVEQP